MATDEMNPQRNDESEKRTSSFKLTLATGMRLLAETTKRRPDQHITTETARSYEIALADLTVEELSAGIQRCLKTCTFFPAAAEIREAAQSVTEERDALEAERAWLTVKRIFEKHWYADLGVQGNAPALDGAAEYALATIGGFHGLAASKREDEHFKRKNFIEAFQRHRTTGGLLAPSRSEAKQLLDRLRSELPSGDEQ